MSYDIHLILLRDPFFIISILGLSCITGVVMVLIHIYFHPVTKAVFYMKNLYSEFLSTGRDIIYFFKEVVSTIKWLDDFSKGK
jgi:hypothetical protein